MKTTNGNHTLINSIRAEIRKTGPVSFAWFMQQALYHPEHGYYSSGRAVIGRKGDYFTSVNVGPLFGQLLAAQFVEIWERLGRIDNFVIVEQGAHDGQFARDVLESVQTSAPEFFAALRYRIVEPFPVWQDRQRQKLEKFRAKVEWRESLEPFVGIHFSNELIDAMPIDLPGKLVDLDGDDFVFVERPASGTGKFNQAALDWVDNVARSLERGYVIAIDYGHTREKFEPAVQVRAQHRHLDSPFEQIGQADISAHVDWPSIAQQAKEVGLRVEGFADQHHFLTGILSTWPHLLQARSLDSTALSGQVSDGRVHPPGSVPVGPGAAPMATGSKRSLDSTALSGQVSRSDADAKSKRELQTLLHPEMLGRSFQVLALSKNVDAVTPLAGLKFSRTEDSLF